MSTVLHGTIIIHSKSLISPDSPFDHRKRGEKMDLVEHSHGFATLTLLVYSVTERELGQDPSRCVKELFLISTFLLYLLFNYMIVNRGRHLKETQKISIRKKIPQHNLPKKKRPARRRTYRGAIHGRQQQ